MIERMLEGKEAVGRSNDDDGNSDRRKMRPDAKRQKNATAYS
jgi:hypothetical protein